MGATAAHSPSTDEGISGPPRRTNGGRGYARYIGRVGGLAFALGVGAAVFAGQGVASADSSDSGSASSESTSQSASDSTSNSSATNSPSGSVGSGSASTPGSDSTSGTASEAEQADADDETGEIGSIEAGSASHPKAGTAPKSDSPTATQRSTRRTQAAADESAEPTNTTVHSDSPPKATPTDTDDTVADSPAAADSAAPVSADQVTASIEPAVSVNAATSVAPESATVALAVDAGSPTPTPTPAAPAPTLAGLLETLFAGFQRTFFNRTPTLAYSASETEIVDGRIVGALHPADPDGEAVTVTATDPAFGTVEIHADGTFTYTPGPEYSGHDMFDVTVSEVDTGFHIHGFSGLLNLVTFGLLGNAGHSVTQTINIGFVRTPVVSGLSNPVDFRFLPDGRIVIGEQGGAIRVVENGVLQSQPLIVLSTGTGAERGISGVAVDPDFATNGFLYVAYTSAANRDRLSRITVTGNTAGSETVLLETEPAGFIHHGGALGFGPDGKLYWGVGDDGIGANAKDLANLRGKILRLNTDGSAPSDNPFFGDTDARQEIYAYGFRNPFRLTFTPDDQLLVADVGQVSWEEVNLVEAGQNYGWPSAEGVCNSCTSVNPIYAYPRGAGAAITSVLVYTGDTFDPSYLNKVFIADVSQGWIKVLSCEADFSSCSEEQTFDAQAGATVNLAQGPDGNLYHLTYQPGELVRISPTSGATPVEV